MAALLVVLQLCVPQALATPGVDFVPANWATTAPVDADGSTRSYALMDAVLDRGAVWLLYLDAGALVADVYDLNSGADGALAGAPVPLLVPDTTPGSVEALGINSAQVARCSTESVTGDSLVWDGGVWRTSQIGVVPRSVRVSGSGGNCQLVRPLLGSFVEGFEDNGAETTDGFRLENAGGCVSFAASYEYTTCSFTGSDAYHCPLLPGPVPDGDAEYGACSHLLVYEGNYDADNDAATPADRVLLTAHAAELTGPWERHLPSGSSFPTPGDIRVAHTGRHGGDASANLHSFTSVPTLHFDPGAGLWRMWFVTEETRGHSIRYTESDDNGRSWGVGGGSGGPIDCWDGGAYDLTACSDIEWSFAPPDDISGADLRTPDIVDPEVLWGNFDGVAGGELGMLFTGGDEACADADWGVQLFQTHADRGDQSNGALWEWRDHSLADPAHGVVIDKDGSRCTGAGYVMDAEVVRVGSGWLGFFNAAGGIALAASGYACSDFRDNDGAGGTDWPADPDCLNPWDRSE